MLSNKPDLSVVIPVYGAPELVEPLVSRLEAALTPLVATFEVVLVNDACPKNSWEQIERLARDKSWLVGLKLSRNFGQHCAISAGLDHAQGNRVVVMDCDLQDRPEEIPKLLEKADCGYDVVFGRRVDRQDSLLKTLPGTVFNRLFNWLSDHPVDRTIGNFSVIDRRVVEAYRQYRERDRAYPLLVMNLGFRQTAIEIEHAKRPSGQSAYSFMKLLDFSVQILVSSSNKPLRMVAKFGLVVAALSMVYALWLVVGYLQTRQTVPGWTTLAVLISFFSGLILVQLGVLGLYLGRTFNEAKRRPLYHVASVLNGKSEA